MPPSRTPLILAELPRQLQPVVVRRGGRGSTPIAAGSRAGLAGGGDGHPPAGDDEGELPPVADETLVTARAAAADADADAAGTRRSLA